MNESDFWLYAIPATAFFFGFVVGAVFIIVRESERENELMKKKLQKVCRHLNSSFTDFHPEFPWTCNQCDANHDGNGMNQE